MSGAKGAGRIPGKGKGRPMEGRQIAIGGANPVTMQVAAEEPVWTSASGAALGGRAPTGVGPPLRASAAGDGQHWPADASGRNVAMQPTLPKALSPERRVRQQTQVHLTPAKGGSRTTATTLVDRSPYANRSPHAHKQLSALPSNAHSDTTNMHSRTVRNSPTPTPHRQPPATPHPKRTSIPKRQRYHYCSAANGMEHRCSQSKAPHTQDQSSPSSFPR